MIRIDEIYNNTLWPFIKQQVPKTRLFYCDPWGTSDPSNLCNYGNSVDEKNYLLMHDQEPIHPDIHHSLFDATIQRNIDIINSPGPSYSGFISSEHNSEYVEKTISTYGWQHFYYFFHGWASLDWYRGYDKTFLIPPYDMRKPTHSFVCPNRIIGGYRQHRVLLIYWLAKLKIQNAFISAPLHCPVEGDRITAIALKYIEQYPDILHVLDSAGLPWHMPNEDDHPMHSCWLSLFDENATSLVHVATETVFWGRRNHLTEKTFKPICLQMPFILVTNAHSLEYLRRYGFRTFGEFWDESYDENTNDLDRLEQISLLLQELDGLSTNELQSLHKHLAPVVKHNFEHFYGGDFERVLWIEMQTMLKDIENDFRI
jgi:hypothetical protein